MIELLIITTPPGLLLILGAALFPLLPHRAQQGWLVLLPILSFCHMWFGFPDVGYNTLFELFDYTLKPIYVDKLSLLWGTVFHIAALLSGIYAMHVKDPLQHVAGMAYAGAAIAAVFAGDLATLFVFWELTAITSVFLIWAGRTERAYKVGLRYLIVQVSSGVILLAGLLMRVHATGRIDFVSFTEDFQAGAPWAAVILLAFGIKAAFPFLHNWLQDAYPEATPSGTVFLSAFTTKLAIYALIRGFPGTEILVPIGAVMAAFPIFFAVIENDLRRVLAYSLNNQLGYMVVGIGIGTPLALNGAAAHAFAHILYKGLLFMSMGAVLHRVGTVKGSELGGLYKSMPWTTLFCIIGAASISAFPLFSGFISKSLILSAAAHEHQNVAYMILLFASAGVFHHSGIKIPYFAFFAHDSGKRCEEAPTNMLVAMGIASAFCIGLGVFYGPLYGMLPFEMDHAYVPYTAEHVVTQYQLLLFSALAFVFLQKYGLYPPELKSTVLDTDWSYRRALPSVARSVHGGLVAVRGVATLRARQAMTQVLTVVERYNGPGGIMSETWPTGRTALWAAVMLSVYLLLEGIGR